VESSPLERAAPESGRGWARRLAPNGPAATVYRGAELVPITYADGTSDDWRPPRSGKVHM